MLVKQILAAKATPGVLTIDPGASVSDAVAELAARRIGALVVSADGSAPVGILSERDIVREIGRGGAEVLSRPVSAMMTRDVQTAACGESAESVLGRMTEGRFRHMPVMDQGAMVGIVTLGDMVKARLTEVSAENDALQSMMSGY